MNKNDLIAKVSDKTQLSRNDATRAVEAVLDVITDSMKLGEEVKIVGFGTFAVSNRAATTGRNPRTGEEIKNSGVEAAEIQGRQAAQRRNQLIWASCSRWLGGCQRLWLLPIRTLAGGGLVKDKGHPIFAACGAFPPPV